MASPVVEGRIAPWEQFVHQCKYGFVRFHHNVQNIVHRFQTMGPHELAEAFPPPNVLTLLGKRYVLNRSGLEQFMCDWSKIYRMTYRQGFASMYRPVAPQEHITLTGDAGWGCMIRVAQMMIALTLRRASPQDEEQLLNWFLDIRSAPFGIFQFVHSLDVGAAHHVEKHRRPAGDWFGPTTVSYAIEKLVSLLGGQMQVYLNVDSVIYQDVVHNLGMWRDRKSVASNASCYFMSDSQGSCDFDWSTSPRQDHISWMLPDMERSWRPDAADSETDKEDLWQRSVLILLPLQLSSDATAPKHVSRRLIKYLDIPQSVGILGGRPRVAFFIVGYVGDTLLYVDPHFVQDAATCGRDFASFRNDPDRHIGTMPLEHLDSSVSVAFLCRSQQEFDSLCECLAAPELDLISVERTQKPMDSNAEEIICIEDNRFEKSPVLCSSPEWDRSWERGSTTASWDFELEPAADVVFVHGSPSINSQEFVVLSDDESTPKRANEDLMARDRYYTSDPNKCQFVMISDTQLDESSDFLYLDEDKKNRSEPS